MIAIDKRIKRRVTAREHRFFTVVSPGLINICRQELDDLFQGRKAIIETDGGLEFDGTVNDCYAANLHLRTASRIIMRIGSFTVRDFQTLEKKCSEFDWDLYLPQGGIPNISVTVKKSRLYHSDAVVQRIRESLIRKTGWETSSLGTAPRLFVRGIQDRFDISVDSSGELLYKRGLASAAAKAPLRETLAAGILKIAGYDGIMPLIDPMCGSGTFSREATLMALNIPPGWFREFAFTTWPCFREGQWKHIRRSAASAIRNLDDPSHEPMIFASDKDPSSIDLLADSLRETPLSGAIRTACLDFFRLDPDSIFSRKGLVILNPPYGHRLGSETAARALIRSIFKTLETRFRGWRTAVLSPYEKTEIQAPKGMKQHPIFHGGLNLHLIYGRIPD